jgi:hypothetical protein
VSLCKVTRHGETEEGAAHFAPKSWCRYRDDTPSDDYNAEQCPTYVSCMIHSVISAGLPMPLIMAECEEGDHLVLNATLWAWSA